MSEAPSALAYWSRELTVPAVMAAGVAVFVFDSRHLSTEAMLLPAGLILVIVAALAWAVAAAFARRPALGAGPPAAEAEDEDTAVGPILNAKAWALAAVPVVLFSFVDQLGALLVLVAIVFATQFVLGARSPARALLVAVLATVPVYALFKYVLYARFPAGQLGLG